MTCLCLYQYTTWPWLLQHRFLGPKRRYNADALIKKKNKKTNKKHPFSGCTKGKLKALRVGKNQHHKKGSNSQNISWGRFLLQGNHGQKGRLFPRSMATLRQKKAYVRRVHMNTGKSRVHSKSYSAGQPTIQRRSATLPSGHTKKQKQNSQNIQEPITDIRNNAQMAKEWWQGLKWL